MENWKTTLGGILAAIGIAGSQVPAVPEKYRWPFAVAGAVGVALVGATAKDFTTHSTVKEVQKATVEKIEEANKIVKEAK